MSMSWRNRKARLAELLQSNGDDDEEGLALDRLLHGQSVIGKTAKTKEVDSLRFTDKDLQLLGTLEYGQFGVVDVVSCKCDGRVYVRKSIDKQFALRNAEQCFPQVERDLLLRAAQHASRWAPHLLCAFQTPTHLNLVMDYAEGGTLWDVLESSPRGMRIPEADVRWWAPQIASAVHWCHAQGFVHRDVKPQNFVLTAASRVLLIDFGSAAPLLPPRPDGAQLVPTRYCLVPCGTCDYISPEILEAHEQALMALDLDDDDDDDRPAPRRDEGREGYGRETDWWSFGVMLYEMVYGVAPFFADDVRTTYLRIMDHKASYFTSNCLSLANLVRTRLLTDASERLGRHSISDIVAHPFFDGIDWGDLHERDPPESLHLPQYTYAAPADATADGPADDTPSQGFRFSQLFQSSPLSGPGASADAQSILQATPAQRLSQSRSSSMRERAVASFIGFSWGPRVDAFGPAGADSDLCMAPSPARSHARDDLHTPRVSKVTLPGTHPFVTPLRKGQGHQPNTVPRTGTIRRTDSRRPVSDREAMKQLLECVGMSARKKMIESGKKPRGMGLGEPPSALGRGRSGSASLRKELRFDMTPRVGRSLSTSVVDAGDVSSLGDDGSGTEGPPSPSPSARPSSAMSGGSRRSRSPTSMSRSLPLRRLSVGAGERGERTPEPGGGLSERALDGMERRHSELVQRIARLEARLARLGGRDGPL
ncbi:kinase-like protein [Gloeophyllum trabeum ATCC 11539]|uniref:Kinase-like protein n=1 Tax=Gloeophyllum trabeum (strain ATCC 11539 / FP-39264 / Madison 617) TaxID=670483 RepID=S7PWM5_GLOTA|nr:kinase-like protein [Gloeophyllum trabeum ATCC 11539]EPQ52006.1 kinase-like protein [Gloeophyllum trabeum ATCC 11539]